MSQPAGMVSVDDRALGMSPRQIRLPAGPHRVSVETRGGQSHSVSVKVLGGKTVSVMLNP
jgi:hypothetical protein